MNVAIIGAGLGGLSCGIHLLSRGFQVKIYEKNSEPGGRASVLADKGFRFDMGPTLILMPEVLEGVFRAAGRSLEDFISLKKIDPAYRVHFADGQTFEMTTDRARLLSQIQKFVPNGERAFERYCADVKAKFEGSRANFIEKNFNSVLDMVSLESLAGFLKIRPFGNAYDHVFGYFREPHLAAAFSCQTLYLGESPFRVPSLYNLLAYLEFTAGIHYPEGGIGVIPRMLARLFVDLGGTLQCGSEVESIVIEERRAKGVRLADGTIELADAVVSNRDIGASYLGFVDQKDRPSLPDRRIRSWNYGQSCVLFYLGIRKKIPELLHHNIFLSPDFRKSCDQIFAKGALPEDPLLYVCVPSKTDPTTAPPGKEAVYILALTPNLKGFVDWQNDIGPFRERVLARLGGAGVKIGEADIEVAHVFTPLDFEARYGALYGSAFGLGPGFFQSACFRPAIRSRDVRGLYHTGASTHPGTGIPMVLTSGRLAAEAVAADGVSRKAPSREKVPA